jgi:hypothetical protein
MEEESGFGTTMYHLWSVYLPSIIINLFPIIILLSLDAKDLQ